MTKSHELREMLARVRFVLRRCHRGPSSSEINGVRIKGVLEIDFDNAISRRYSKGLNLGVSHLELSLLNVLLDEGAIVSHSALVELLYARIQMFRIVRLMRLLRG
ncbi:MAG: hypothetical protein AB8B62_16140 [Roseobacter sp.]